ncbi:spore coat protein [Planotetraspora thailandica]|uniref:Spore coat protein n=1 Tax=Planotetraspora thailandica TaxID=487172 RepID=A0A8J3XX98_9ACTN|nr:multicopper oxidase domain-containing protein [Planotetraspora thailandica]GII55641.1 spore coat protein [Planotetraspora thailandica]
MELTRREFLLLAAVSGAAASTVKTPDRPPPPVRLAKYVDPMPRLPVAVPHTAAYPGADYYELTMRQSPWRFHRDLPEAHAWGFWASGPSAAGGLIGLGYLGPTIVAHRDRPVVVKYRNDLPTTHLLQSAVDVTLWKNVPGVPPDPPGGRMPQDFPAVPDVWTVTHLHGGFDAPQFDGGPEAWFTPGGIHGPGYATMGGAAANEALYGYTSRQPATMLWYHDHAMAITRLNNYAGLSGAYLIRDRLEESLALPRGDFEVPLILQDRSFTPGGALFYPDKGPSPYHPKWNPNVFGEIPVVNGKAYPYLAVEPRRYRLRVLNASNQRFFHMWFQEGGTLRPFWVIGTDGGFRASPLRLTSVLLPPAARLDLILDLTGTPPGTTITLRNDAPTPYPQGGKGTPMPEIMRFNVTPGLSSPDRTATPDRLRLPSVPPLRPTPGLPSREFVLIANKDAAGKSTHLAINQRFFTDPVEEFPRAGTTEVWEYVNASDDAHPMHVHLVQFQILNRQRFDAKPYRRAFEKWIAAGRDPAAKPVLRHYLRGEVIGPMPEEMGWKDIAVAFPDMVTRIVLRFDLPPEIAGVPGTRSVTPAEYVQHCHMVEHEDNEMMRPWQVIV